MKALMLSLLIIVIMPPLIIFDFSKDSNISNWIIVDDVVMGGRSKGNIAINKDGHAVFSGKLSLENNGGFSSLRHRFKTIRVKEYSNIVIKVKGDGKIYQLRFKANRNDKYSYVNKFETTSEWQTISLNLNDFYPSYRGRKLDAPNFESTQIEELTFLFSNEKAEEFKLLIDSISLK